MSKEWMDTAFAMSAIVVYLISYLVLSTVAPAWRFADESRSVTTILYSLLVSDVVSIIGSDVCGGRIVRTVSYVTTAFLAMTFIALAVMLSIR